MAVMGFSSPSAPMASRSCTDMSRAGCSVCGAFDEARGAITSITNGVHGPTWVAREGLRPAAPREGVGPDTADTDRFWVVDQIPAERLWATKRELRALARSRTRRRVTKSWQKRGAARPSHRLDRQRRQASLDPDVPHDRLRARRRTSD